jgi:hypothetical protein|mmetsp:Transcript_33892/g.54153  ORF Transcript_33892/g.54153 Transcript_33892/m.54153 type:complete len:472 (+) Transcript_33892:65-1480(+)
MVAFILALSISCFVSSVAAETGCYKVSQTMEQWKEAYPTGIPNNIHYSGMAIITHTSAYSLSEVGSAASAGLKLLAETGNSNSGAGTLQTEVTASTAANRLTRLVPIIAPNSDQTATPNTKRGFADAHIEVDSNFPMVSLATMIAPSPDWYAFGKATLFENGAFQTKTVNLYAYDAGTDSGPNYTSENSATNPVGVISYLDHGVEGPSTTSTTNRLMMTMTFEPMCCYTAVQSDMDRWVTVYNDSLPTNPHYSSMVAWTWSDGSLLVNGVSSAGAQALAETGSADTFVSELNSYSFTPSSTSLMAAQKLTVMAGTGQTDGTGGTQNTKRMFQNFRMMVSTTFPKVGMMTMIAPSPDWYAYADDVLYDGTSWHTKSITLVAWDAGTDSGPTYTSVNNATSPKVAPSKLTYGVEGHGLTGDRTMFTMTFTPDPTCNRMSTSSSTGATDSSMAKRDGTIAVGMAMICLVLKAFV